MNQFEHINFRAGYWKLNVYLDGECIYTFTDNSGDIYATLRDFPGEDGSSFLNELIDELQNNLMRSGKRKLNKDEIETLKRKMIDLDSWQDD